MKPVEEEDVEKCKGHFHGINIKLTKCSGITPARRMITHARKAGLKVMVGCMNESTIGSAAIAHLLPFIDHVDMDGPLLLAEDLATGIEYDFGKIGYSQKPGWELNIKVCFKINKPHFHLHKKNHIAQMKLCDLAEAGVL
jgi:L-alanine-DL-glutamate epimerase-like enolase superfamily enzyme